MTVRLAAPADELALYEMLVALYHDNPMGLQYDPPTVLGRIREGTEQKGAVIGVIDGDQGDIAASVGLFPHTIWYSNVWNYAELWLFVRPEYRNSSYSDELFDFCEYIRARMEAQLGRPFHIQTSVSSEVRLPAKERLWGRRARKIGALYVMDGTARR